MYICLLEFRIELISHAEFQLKKALEGAGIRCLPFFLKDIFGVFLCRIKGFHNKRTPTTFIGMKSLFVLKTRASVRFSNMMFAILHWIYVPLKNTTLVVRCCKRYPDFSLRSGIISFKKYRYWFNRTKLSDLMLQDTNAFIGTEKKPMSHVDVWKFWAKTVKLWGHVKHFSPNRIIWKLKHEKSFTWKRC